MARHKVDIYMPLYVRDFLTSTLGWSAEERGHYLTLLMVAWDRGGLPAELDQIERLSPGVTAVWPMLQDKFPVGDDGLRRNARLEKHRDRCVELKDKRIEAGKRAAAAKAAAIAARANGEQSCSNRAANVQQTVPIGEPIVQQTVPIGAAIVKHPTSTSTSTPTSTSPNGEDKYTPGWLERAREALARLPSRQFFDRPLPVTRFFDFVDRIRAGEFADPKGHAKARPRQPAGGNL